MSMTQDTLILKNSEKLLGRLLLIGALSLEVKLRWKEKALRRSSIEWTLIKMV